MFTKTAKYYDRIYSFKDYPAEVEKLLTFIPERLRSKSSRLLDVACGTGTHLNYLREHFTCAGLDLSAEFVNITRERFPDLEFYEADMIDFDLGRQYEIVVSLFSSIGYVKTIENLNKAIACMARHLAPGGILIVEPWFTPDTWIFGKVHSLQIDEPDLKIARVGTSLSRGRLSYFDLHYLIGTPEGTEHFVERHELGLFDRAEMEAAFTAAGLSVTYDSKGLNERGLYLGAKK